MGRHWGSLEEIEAHVFEEYGRTMFELQRFEFALERLAGQSGSHAERPTAPDADAWVEWAEWVRYKPPKKKLELFDVDDDLKAEVRGLLERRDEFAHELLLAGRDASPRFEPTLARELIAQMQSLVADARQLRERLERERVGRGRKQASSGESRRARTRGGGKRRELDDPGN